MMLTRQRERVTHKVMINNTESVTMSFGWPKILQLSFPTEFN